MQLVRSFRPSLSPKEVLHSGAFGGTYFRDIDSAVTGKRHRDVWRELPKGWLRGLDVQRQLARAWEDYDVLWRGPRGGPCRGVGEPLWGEVWQHAGGLGSWG